MFIQCSQFDKTCQWRWTLPLYLCPFNCRFWGWRWWGVGGWGAGHWGVSVLFLHQLLTGKQHQPHVRQTWLLPPWCRLSGRCRGNGHLSWYVFFSEIHFIRNKCRLCCLEDLVFISHAFYNTLVFFTWVPVMEVTSFVTCFLSLCQLRVIPLLFTIISEISHISIIYLCIKFASLTVIKWQVDWYIKFCGFIL